MARKQKPRQCSGDLDGCMMMIVFAFLGVLALWTLTACAMRQVQWDRVTTTHLDGSVTEEIHVVYLNHGFDTSAGVVKLGRDEHGNPTFSIENLSSQDIAARVGLEAIELAKSLSTATP